MRDFKGFDSSRDHVSLFLYTWRSHCFFSLIWYDLTRRSTVVSCLDLKKTLIVKTLIEIQSHQDWTIALVGLSLLISWALFLQRVVVAFCSNSQVRVRRIRKSTIRQYLVENKHSDTVFYVILCVFCGTGLLIYLISILGRRAKEKSSASSIAQF